MSFISQLFEELGPLAIFALIVPIILVLAILRMLTPFWPIALAFGVILIIGIIVIMALQGNAGKLGRGPLDNVP